MTGARNHPLRLHFWLIGMWLILAGVSVAQTGPAVSLGRPQRMTLPSLGTASASQSPPTAQDAGQTSMSVPVSESREIAGTEGPQGSPQSIVGTPPSISSGSLIPSQIIPGFDSRSAQDPSKQNLSGASNKPGPTSIPANSALPESVSEVVNQRYQDALNAVPSEVGQGTSPLPPGSAGSVGGSNPAAQLPNTQLPNTQLPNTRLPNTRLPNTEPSANELPAPATQGNPRVPTPEDISPPSTQPSLNLLNDPAAGRASPVPGAPEYGLPGGLLIPGAPLVPNQHGQPPIPALGGDGVGPVSGKSPAYQGPFWLESVEEGLTHMDPRARTTFYDSNAFLPAPINPIPDDPYQQSAIYRGKYPVPTQRPLLELGRPLYTGGIYPPAGDWLGFYNPVMPHLMVYGDFRTGAAANRNRLGEDNVLAVRLNLEVDFEITATERLHGFIGPVDRAGDFTRFEFNDGVEYVNRTDLRLDTLFFEGDAGAIWGGLTGQDAPFDFPFTFGFLPIFYQNGVWAADNVIGAAFALPWRNSPALKWSNFDATFFWASDQINSDAFPGDNNAAEFFGTAWFIEAYDGYFEVDYAFVHDDVGEHRSYHNFSVAFTRRYLNRVSNSVRFITNFDQSLPTDQRTADGHLLLIENSLISSAPNTCVPYLNFFYGQGRTQSLARAGVAGGILFNTGINFQIDGLTGYPTLDSTGVNSTGAALGINMLGQDFSHQLILEAAALAATGDAQFRNAPGDQFAVGMRYQIPLSNAWIFRTDQMVGFLRNAEDIRGSRFELRWKF